MIFCQNCDNMMYIHVDASDASSPKLLHICKNCKFERPSDSETLSAPVVRTNYEDDQTSYKQFMSPYLALDPTLPHSSEIACTNQACTRPPSQPSDVIFIKYDAVQLKYLYHCVHCKQFWKLAAGPTAS